MITQAIFSLSTNSLLIFSGYSTSIWQPNLSAWTLFAFIAYSINSIGFVILGISCNRPVSTWVIFNNSPVILKSRLLFSFMLSESCFCSSFSSPTRLSSNSLRLIKIAEIGVFNSWDIVEISVVFAESRSLNSVILFNKIIFPMFFCSFSPASTIRIGIYFAWK